MTSPPVEEVSSKSGAGSPTLTIPCTRERAKGSGTEASVRVRAAGWTRSCAAAAEASESAQHNRTRILMGDHPHDRAPRAGGAVVWAIASTVSRIAWRLAAGVVGG